MEPEFMLELEQIYQDIRHELEKVKGNRDEFSKVVYSLFQPTDLEKKKNAEIGTPYTLRNEMLDKVPLEFWTNKTNHVLEPCCGKCGFLIDIINRFMNGLEEEIPDEDERYQWIVEKCLYWGDINPLNTAICKILLDPYKKGYRLNGYTGDMLSIDIEKEYGVNGFDLVVGNPPYNNSQNNTGKKGGGDSLWNKFVKKFIDVIGPNKYLSFVHPSGWRKPESKLSKTKGFFELLTNQNQMIYLNINDTKKGMSVFGCGTRYDWYVLQNIPCYTTTRVIDETGKDNKLDLREWRFLPNKNYEIIRKFITDEKCDDNIIFSRSSYGSDKNHVSHTQNIIFNISNYETRKKHVSHTQTPEFEYPLIHATNKSGTRYFWSSCNDRGHFGIPKVIFGETGLNHVILDKTGEYGMTQHAMAIPVENPNDFELLEHFLLSDKFQEILKSCSWSNYRIDWRLFTYLKPRFWREFLDE